MASSTSPAMNTGRPRMRYTAHTWLSPKTDSGSHTSSTRTTAIASRIRAVVPMMARKRPATNQRAVVMAVWAKRFKDVATFTVDELLKHWRNSGEKLPMKATRDVGLAVSEGWLERLADGDKFQVTSYGERYVDEQLQPKGK